MAETKMTPQEVATFWFKKCSELEAKLKDTEANYNNLVNNSFGMTYEQIVDLKCENARLREENTKFEKWQRLLDKIKIF